MSSQNANIDFTYAAGKTSAGGGYVEVQSDAGTITASSGLGPAVFLNSNGTGYIIYSWEGASPTSPGNPWTVVWQTPSGSGANATPGASQGVIHTFNWYTGGTPSGTYQYMATFSNYLNGDGTLQQDSVTSWTDIGTGSYAAKAILYHDGGNSSGSNGVTINVSIRKQSNPGVVTVIVFDVVVMDLDYTG
jgi:hypothetical protein